MKEINASQLAALHSLFTKMILLVDYDNDKSEWLSDAQKKEFLAIGELSSIGAQGTRIPCTLAHVERLVGLLQAPYAPKDGMVALAKEARGRLSDELDRQMFFRFEAGDEELYKDRMPFGPSVGQHFATAQRDISEAAKCVALARGTACVLHCTRIYEVALEATYKAASIPGKAPANWGEALKKINVRAGELQNDPSQKALVKLLRLLAGQIDHIRVSWRNEAIHTTEDYTPEEARDIFDQCRLFMKAVSARINEDGVSVPSSSASADPL